MYGRIYCCGRGAWLPTTWRAGAAGTHQQQQQPVIRQRGVPPCDSDDTELLSCLIAGRLTHGVLPWELGEVLYPAEIVLGLSSSNVCDMNRQQFVRLGPSAFGYRLLLLQLAGGTGVRSGR